eukprot:TRINITY_DN5993_c0_g1_i1.p1 TRINITY_DN5993_c0_g1~~TRINITY_DN5993_c0_g1_i1.p1  ORF type:complete len:335 (-),score=105.11 TRINITY_DN5993_c0_g1_i1:125-1129(-)
MRHDSQSAGAFMDRRLMIIFGLTASLVAVVLVATFSGGRSESEILHDLLQQKQLELAKKEEMLKAKEALLKEKDAQIQTQEQQIDQDVKLLEDTNVELDKATYDKEEKEEQLEEKENLLQETKAAIETLNNTVVKMDKQLASSDEDKEDSTIANEIEFQAKVEEQVESAPDGRLTNHTDFLEQVHFVKLDTAFTQVNLLSVKAARFIVKPEKIFLHCRKEPTGPNWLQAKAMIDEIVLFKPGELEAPPLPGLVPLPAPVPAGKKASDDDDDSKTDDDDSDDNDRRKRAPPVAQQAGFAAAAAGVVKVGRSLRVCRACQCCGYNAVMLCVCNVSC